MTQSKTLLIKDTGAAVCFPPGPQHPLPFPIFPPFKASTTKDIPFTKCLWTFCAYFVANMRRITKPTGQINKTICLVVYYKRYVPEFLLAQTTILGINENICVKHVFQLRQDIRKP